MKAAVDESELLGHRSFSRLGRAACEGWGPGDRHSVALLVLLLFLCLLSSRFVSSLFLEMGSSDGPFSLAVVIFFFSFFFFGAFIFLSPVSGCRTYIPCILSSSVACWDTFCYSFHFSSALVYISIYYTISILSIYLCLCVYYFPVSVPSVFHLPVPSNHHLNHSSSLPYLSISLHLFFHPSFSPSFLHPRFTLTGGSAGNEPVAHLIAMFLAWLSAIDCGVGNGVWRYCNCRRLCYWPILFIYFLNFFFFYRRDGITLIVLDTNIERSRCILKVAYIYSR